MKIAFIFLVIISACFNTAQAQDKFKPLIERIALLQVHLGYLKKGYNIVKDGLNAVSDVKQVEFNLHKKYFNTLKAVNPKIRKYARVADIMSYHQKMVQEYKRAWERLKNSHQFSPGEISLLTKVYASLMDEAAKDLDQLVSVITDGKLEMKDSERFKQIDQLFLSVLDKYQFLKTFNSEAEILARQRGKELNDIQVTRELFNLK